jgi:hypothetical protein
LSDPVVVVTRGSTVNVQQSSTVLVSGHGPQGPAGPQGPEGPVGGTYFIYSRNGVPAATWTIQHNLHRDVHVTVLGDDNRRVWTDEDHPDDDTIVLTFAAPFSGKAIIG